jgi:hypothetical protein
MLLVNDYDSLEYHFFDADLERLRQDLMAAANDLLHKCAWWGAPHRTLQKHYELGLAECARDNPPEGEKYERFERCRRELGEAADRLVQTYDALVREARRRLPAA